MRPLTVLVDLLLAQRGYLFPWVPVCLSIGIGGYFALQNEPVAGIYVATFTGVLVLAGLSVATRDRAGVLTVGVALVLAGAMIAGARAHVVAEPVLKYRYYGAVEGRIVNIDRSASDKVRLTLDRVVMERLAPDRTPARVRVSLHGQQGYVSPEPGLTVILTAHLSPPQGPVEPGGFDFQRMAWFQRLGAVGYTRAPVLALVAADEGRAGLFIHRTRLRISSAVQAALPGETGAFAAAIITGDRSGMGQQTLADLRASNLAHLLAISGLHMGLLTAFIFGTMRYGLSLWSPFALRVPVKKIAAVVALIAASGYLALSGGNVATERAFIMVVVMLGAVLFNRRALTLRAVALAATVILILHPEALTGPGFQMSFAATTALVAVFGALRDWSGVRLPQVLRPIAAVVVSSAVAGAATAPIAAAHFNQISHFGLIANLLTVPLMGALVMPAAVVAGCLAPFGLAWVALAVMQLGIVWILGVAHWVAGLDGALSHVVTPDASVLPLFALGMLWLILWQGRLRFGGLAGVAAALVIWVQTERPVLLIAESGGLVGVLTPQGRALSKEKGDGFAARSWLENDGDPVDQATAFTRVAFNGDKGERLAKVAGQTILHLTGKGAGDRIDAGCAAGNWVVTTAKDRAKDDAFADCVLLGPERLRETGTLAVYKIGKEIKLVSAKDSAGQRIWNAQ